VLAFSPAAFPQGVFGAPPAKGWARLAPVGFGGAGSLGCARARAFGYSHLGAGAPPPPPPPAGYQRTPQACPTDDGSSNSAPAATSTPVPAVRWIRYQDKGLQETYARIYGALRQPAVAGITIVPEEQADMMARQVVDAIIALPQSSELKYRIGCMAKSYINGPIGIAVGVMVLLGLGGAGFYAYRRSKRAG
jgi:hypothetical protein